jgi:hypothetical protein
VLHPAEERAGRAREIGPKQVSVAMPSFSALLSLSAPRRAPSCENFAAPAALRLIAQPPSFAARSSTAPRALDALGKISREMSSTAIVAPAIVNEALSSSGQPLDAKTRAFMEPRFGHDFARVRIHADERAAASARAVDAHAYTVGSNIVFGAGEFQPDSPQGRTILAHELAHVVQQSAATHPPSLQRWAISGNRATANREGDTLGALAQEVGAKFQDWKCIRPSPSMKRANAPNRPADFDEHYDRYISLGDKFEFANLTQTNGPALHIHLFDAKNPYTEVAELFYPGMVGTKDPQASIEASANAGRTPIQEMVIFGHAHKGTMFGDATVFTPRDSNSEEPAPSFTRAVEQRYPQRGWFTRNARVRSVGCDSEAWGMDFARRFLREGATVTTTTATPIGSCSGKSPEYVAIGTDCKYKLDGLSFRTPGGIPLEGPFWTASEFHGAGYWADVEGKL